MHTCGTLHLHDEFWPPLTAHAQFYLCLFGSILYVNIVFFNLKLNSKNKKVWYFFIKVVAIINEATCCARVKKLIFIILCANEANAFTFNLKLTATERSWDPMQLPGRRVIKQKRHLQEAHN